MLCSYKKEMLLCLAGPLTNIMLSLFLLPLYNTNTFFDLFIKASLFLGILNLLPIYEFDGGRILFCILSYKLPPRTSITVIRVISFILIFALWSLSVYLLLRLSSSISLFIFSISLFSKIFLSQRENLY